MIFISSLILSSTHFSEFLMRSSSQGCLCQRNACNLSPTPVHPAHYPVSDRSKHQLLYKKTHETLQEDMRKSPAYKEEIFSPLSLLPADWYKRWIKRSTVLQKSCYCKNETHSHIWILYSYSNTQWVSANGAEILPLTLSLHVSPLSGISKALQPVGRNRDIADLRLTHSGALLPWHLMTVSFTGNCRHPQY